MNGFSIFSFVIIQFLARWLGFCSSRLYGYVLLLPCHFWLKLYNEIRFQWFLSSLFLIFGSFIFGIFGCFVLGSWHLFGDLLLAACLPQSSIFLLSSFLLFRIRAAGHALALQRRVVVTGSHWLFQATSVVRTLTRPFRCPAAGALNRNSYFGLIYIHRLRA